VAWRLSDAETLRAIARGRTPGEAATRLNVHRRTVDKHQRIYAKLGWFVGPDRQGDGQSRITLTV
jgi:hypothetical protein